MPSALVRSLSAALVAALCGVAVAHAQTVTQRGFAETRAAFFPLDAPNDSTNAVVDFLAREEAFVKPSSWIQFAAGVDFRASTHDRVEDSWALDWRDRTVARPRLSIRRLSATISRRWLTIDAGKQFIRWGKTDIVTPTDRFAPRDFLDVFDNEFLPVAGVRAVARAGGESVEGVWIPRLTPSRIPLLNERWTVIGENLANVPVVDVSGPLPRGSEVGVRWNHIGAGFESSLSFFDGFNHLPNVNVVVQPTPLEIEVSRVYPAIRSYGGDVAMPLRWATVKGEAAYVRSQSSTSDDYVLYVVQLERQTGEWTIVGGYAGEAVTARRTVFSFAPDRGASRAFIGRASYTIDPNRTIAFESAVRQTLAAAYAKAEYSQAHGQHWRTTIAGTIIRGEPTDFIGQYRRNSNAAVSIRYSF